MSVVESDDPDGGRHLLIWAAIAKKNNRSAPFIIYTGTLSSVLPAQVGSQSPGTTSCAPLSIWRRERLCADRVNRTIGVAWFSRKVVYVKFCKSVWRLLDRYPPPVIPGAARRRRSLRQSGAQRARARRQARRSFACARAPFWQGLHSARRAARRDDGILLVSSELVLSS
jgi:hypothetical protein